MFDVEFYIHNLVHTLSFCFYLCVSILTCTSYAHNQAVLKSHQQQVACGMAAWLHGGMAAWRHGGMVAWRP